MREFPKDFDTERRAETKLEERDNATDLVQRTERN